MYSTCTVSAPLTTVRLTVQCLQLLLTMWAGRVTINILPDDVLLHIFHSDRMTYLGGLEDADPVSWRWQRFVHVCRRWRIIVFASPNFLDLRLVCLPWTRVELTGIWPPLPIVIRNMVDLPMPEDYDFEAAIMHHNRVCEIHLLNLTSSQLKRLAAAMEKNFPALIHLKLDFDIYDSRPAPALPDRFLGGLAVRLESLRLHSITFPALPKLFLSATHLVRLCLRDIPHSGYFSPEVIAAGLAVLTNLESFTIGFGSPLSRPDQERRLPPPPTRTILPALADFEFHGSCEYLEDLVARIDVHLLDFILISFFHQLVFHIPQLAEFMRRTAMVEVPYEAYMNFNYSDVQLEYLPHTRIIDEKFRLMISCRKLDWQLSSLAQVLTSFFPSIHVVEHLYIYGPQYLLSQWEDDIENVQWLEIFHQFTSVKSLHVPKEFAQCIAFALQEFVGERVADVLLPALETLFLEEIKPSGPVQEAIEQFVATRQLLGHPVVVSRWDRA